MRRALKTRESLAALIPLTLAVGYLCQLYDDHYLFAGLFFGVAMVYFVVLAQEWFRFTLVTLAIVYAAGIVAALIGVMQEANSEVLAILAGWTALFFGPKEVVEERKGVRRDLLWFAALAVMALLVSGKAEDGLRQWVLEKRYQAKGCVQVEVLSEAVVCLDDSGRMLAIDGFFDPKGQRVAYRIDHIEGDRAIRTVVGYATGLVTHRHQVRFWVEGGEVRAIREGYGVLYGKNGLSDLQEGVLIYENDQWVQTQKSTPQLLEALRLPKTEREQ